jgi:curved DNA-binding protein CbpA
MADDFYALLEVPRDADQDQIKSAYREKVQEYHPDHNDDPRANAQFTALRKAYDTLGDPVERNAYDRMGHLDYVAKRLSGLPDPDVWAPDRSGDDATASDSATTSTGGTTAGGSSASGSASSGRSTSGGTATGGSAGSTASASTGTRGTSSTTGSSGSTGSASAGSTGSDGGGSGRRTASDGAGATASARSVAYSDDPIVDFVARHDWARSAVGWPLLYFVMAIYAAGLGAAIAANAEAFGDLVDRITAAGTDTGALADALERESVPVIYDATIGELAAGSTSDPTVLAGGVLIALGAILLPTVVFLLVYLTRLSPGWKPSRLYTVAVLGPLVGLGVGAGMEIPLAAELVSFGLLPFGALLVMVLSAFVRPTVKAALFS